MDFDLSEEQRLLKDSVEGLLNDSYDFEQRKKNAAAKKGWSDEAWKKFAEQGLLGLPFAEADGGFGAGAIETMIVMEAMGKALVVEPYLAHRGARRRLPASWRLGGAAAGAHSLDHRRLEDDRLCAAGEELALRSRRRDDDGQEEGLRLRHLRREVRRRQWRLRRHVRRHGAHGRWPA